MWYVYAYTDVLASASEVWRPSGGSSEGLGGSLNEMPGKIRIRDFGRHIDGLARYEELREAIEDWSNQRRGRIDIKT